MMRAALLALAGALMLSACASPGPQATVAPRPAVAAASLPAPQVIAALPVPKAAKPGPSLAVADLLGADNRSLVRWLGEPALDWREGDHALWQYVQDECVVLLFLEEREGARRVAAIEVRGRETAEDARCGTAFRPRLAQQVH